MKSAIPSFHKRPSVIACLLLLLILLVPIVLTWRAWQQARLDHALIAHIKANDADAVLVDLRQGANANNLGDDGGCSLFRADAAQLRPTHRLEERTRQYRLCSHL